MLSFNNHLYGGHAPKIEHDQYGSETQYTSSMPRSSYSGGRSDYQSQHSNSTHSNSSSRFSSDITNLFFQASPERSTSAPPPEAESAAYSAVRISKSNVHSNDPHYDVTRRLGNMSFTPRSTNSTSGSTSELYSSGSSGSPSPITSLKAPVAKRMVQFERTSSMRSEQRSPQNGHAAMNHVGIGNSRIPRHNSLGGSSPLSSSGGVSSFDAPLTKPKGYLSGGQSFDLHNGAEYRSRSAQPYSNSSHIERSASFRHVGRNGGNSRSSGRSDLLMELGRSVTYDSHIDGGEMKGFQGEYSPPSSASGSGTLYHSAYGFDSKRRGERSRNNRNPSGVSSGNGFRGPAYDQKPSRVHSGNLGFGDREHLTPSHHRRNFRSRDSSALPPRYEIRGSALSSGLPYSQREILDQLLEQQAINAHGGISMRGSGQGSSNRKGGGRNGRRNKGGNGGGGYSSRKTGGTVKGGKSDRSEKNNASSGSKGRRYGGHSMEINTIGIGSKMHVRWVEVFGTAKTAHISLEDVAKRQMIVDLAMDQYGSRFIQQKLEKAPASHKEVAFDQVFDHTLRLCTDVFGNYVIQKLFEHGTMEHKRALAAKLRGHVLTLSLQMYGCRVVQKAIDVLNLDQKSELVRELHGHVMKCVRDQNGNHVIQKCIEKVPPSNIQFIVEAFKGQNMKLAMHPYGCRVIQRLLEHCSGQQRDAILSEVLENTQSLAKNQYGNYVVQHILVHANPDHRAAVMRSFRGNLVRLSKHKFASNVIEKCVTHATRDERRDLIDEMLGDEDLDSASLPLMAMAKDQYANYVVQRLIEVVDPEQRQYLIQRVQHHLPYLSKVPYGKHIIATIEKAQTDSSF
eukprot:CAMPEP_0114529170 /NCGR_PEP_ID=MMETSP0109-20121206/24675_1 /TAXON_ID=29199 /ORGANISM="Chlorarachnion reptans, Strain CCCM449" /LENGTH=847 /DNA_ID=CAMNT_0001711521 /DNA_START=318 /DNA_END=2861 /DNA_ORIENTATION=-